MAHIGEINEFLNWSKKNCTTALYNGMQLAFENYRKEKNREIEKFIESQTRNNQ